MNRIVLVFLSIIFVKLINGQFQSPCETAEQALESNQLCTDVYNAGNDSSLVCNGTCRDLYDGIIRYCGGAGGYRNLIFSLCDPCGIPQAALESTGCADAIFRRNTTAVCMEPCRGLIDDIIANCPNTTSAFYSDTLESFCSPCGMATINFDNDFDCLVATTSSQNSEYVCTGTCRELIDAVIENCDPSTTTNFVDVLNDNCDGGTNTGNCETAYSAIGGTCLSLLNNGDSSACAGTCGTQLSAAVTACESSADAQIQLVITAYNTVCDDGTNTGNCETAYSAVDGMCLSLLNNADSSACSGTCGTQLSAAVTACESSADSQIQLVITAYDRYCGSEAQCTAALQELENEARCQSMDKNDVCSGTCRTLYYAAIDACPDNDAGISREAYINVCGTGSGSMLKASAIITLLFVAMRALIF